MKKTPVRRIPHRGYWFVLDCEASAFYGLAITEITIFNCRVYRVWRVAAITTGAVMIPFGLMSHREPTLAAG